MNDKRKIGCVLAYCDNYGSMLQAYATVRKIQEFGHDCEIIRYRKQRSIIEKLSAFYHLMRISDKSDSKRMLAMAIDKKIYKDFGKKQMTRHMAFDRFGSKYLKPLFKEYVGFEELKQGALNYDVVLVGSDQLWTPMSLYSKYYNLLFVDDSIPKVAYATSFGVSEIPGFQEKDTGAYLNRFNRIGVREQGGKKIVESLSCKKAEVVADPSMLLTKEEWEDVAKDSQVEIHEPYILCIFLGRNMEARDAAIILKREVNMKIVALTHCDEYIKEDDNFGDIQLFDIDPCDFIQLIKNASYICTDSFHCSVFSILFHKQFMVFYRYPQAMKGNRNSRIDNLLYIFNLQNRLYNKNISEIQKKFHMMQ